MNTNKDKLGEEKRMNKDKNNNDRKKQSTTTKREQGQVLTMKIKREAAKHIIGKQGKTHRQLETEFGVKIHVHDPKPQESEQEVTIRGKEDSIKRTKEQIKDLIGSIKPRSPSRDRQNGARSRSSENRQYGKCWYYESGNCRNGSDCKFGHGESKSRSQSRANSRNRSRRGRYSDSDSD